MLRKDAPLCLFLAIAILGNGCSEEAPSTASLKDPSEASSEEEFREIMKTRIDQVLEGWKSADSSARLVLIQEDLRTACGEYAVSDQLSKYFEGMSSEDVKSLLGKPDSIDGSASSGEQTFHYSLGTTTQSTEPVNRNVLSVEIEENGVAKGAYLDLN